MTIYNKHSGCAFCTLKSPIFNLLSQEELEYLNETRTEATFLAGETILKQGAPVSNVLSFVSGFAKAYVEIDRTKNFIIQLYKKQDFIAVPGVYFESINHFTITAIENSRICYIDWTRFKELLNSNHLLNIAFQEGLNRNHVRTIERMTNLYRKQSTGKLAEAIIYLSEIIYNTNKFKLTINIDDFANLAGISKEWAFKVLKELVDSNIISYNKKELEILNIELLKKISEKG
ncbi:MAG: Crp/Fnr family transcriptional regulator [Bacteroidota bacterium]|nr:Crp/Fnr family transcriptional regulator [Bacteroidota bacterium]